MSKTPSPPKDGKPANGKRKPARPAAAPAQDKTPTTGRKPKLSTTRRKPDANPTVSARRTAAAAPPAAPEPAQEAPRPRPVFRRATVTLDVALHAPTAPTGTSGGDVPARSSTGATRPTAGTPPPSPEPRGVPTPDPAPKPLSERKRRFAFEYVQDGNATRAYMRATGVTRYSTASTEGWRYLQNPEIRAQIEVERELLRQRAGIDTEELVRRLAAIVVADPRDLVEHVIEACRYCHGEGHDYQRTDAEFERDRLEFETHGRQRIGGMYLSRRKARERAQDAGEEQRFEPQGGPGFDPHRDPHPECPMCHGHGHGRTIIKDTRALPAQAALLYAGMKETKDGLEVKMHDKLAAAEKLLRIFGAYEEDNRQKARDPLAALIERISGPQAGLPVVSDPDEENGL